MKITPDKFHLFNLYTVGPAGLITGSVALALTNNDEAVDPEKLLEEIKNIDPEANEERIKNLEETIAKFKASQLDPETDLKRRNEVESNIEKLKEYSLKGFNKSNDLESKFKEQTQFWTKQLNTFGEGMQQFKDKLGLQGRDIDFIGSQIRDLQKKLEELDAKEKSIKELLNKLEEKTIDNYQEILSLAKYTKEEISQLQQETKENRFNNWTDRKTLMALSDRLDTHLNDVIESE